VGEARRKKERGEERRGMGLRLGVDFGVASTPKVGEPRRWGGEEEEERGGGEKRHGASPRCGFRSSLHAQGRGPRAVAREARRERKGEKRRGMGLRLGVDSE
jgi:hypothetical protein